MQLPSYIKPRTGPKMSETALAVVGMGASPYLSIEGGRFTLVDAAGNMKPSQQLYQDVVIIDMNENMSKDYRTDEWDPGNPTPPVCFSDNGVAPSINAAQPQSPTCGGCPHNVWGSKISKMGSKVKACRDTHKLAVIVPGEPANVFRLIVTPNSLTNWRGYTTLFQGQPFDLCDVVTRLTFQQGVMGTLEFKPRPTVENPPGTVVQSCWLDEATLALRDAAVTAKAGDAVVGRLDRPRDPALATNPQPAAALTHQPAAQPQATAQSAVFPSTSGAPASTQTGAPAQAASRSEPAAQQPEPAQRGRRRRQTAETPAPQQTTQAAAQPQQTQPQQGQMAPFRQEPAQQAPFGMAAGAAPNADLQATLNSVFGVR